MGNKHTYSTHTQTRTHSAPTHSALMRTSCPIWTFMVMVDYEILPISLSLLSSKLEVGRCGKLKWLRKESPISTIILCHLSIKSEWDGKLIKKNEQVILAHEDTTGVIHVSLSVSISNYGRVGPEEWHIWKWAQENVDVHYGLSFV